MALELKDLNERSRTRLIYGAGKLSELGRLATDLGITRALVVTSVELMWAGHVEHALDWLESHGVESDCHFVSEDPTHEDVEVVAEIAREHQADGFIGLGGGSAMDAAKGGNLLLCHGGRIQDYWGQDKVLGPLLPMIAIPTTAGTGSEVQAAALISDGKTHKKKACVDEHLTPSIAILDPELSVSMPRRVSEASGLDALAHALETAVSRRRTDLSFEYSVEALRLIQKSFLNVLVHPDDTGERASMLLASTYAGLAIEHSMLGAAHACANPLSQDYRLCHGFAVGYALPTVLRYNGQDEHVRAQYAELARASGCAHEDLGDFDAYELLLDTVQAFVAQTGAAAEWRRSGVLLANPAALAKRAVAEWTAGFNPRVLNETELSALYRAMFEELRKSE
jgi:alcohol dehydrogenase